MHTHAFASTKKLRTSTKALAAAHVQPTAVPEEQAPERKFKTDANGAIAVPADAVVVTFRR